MEYIGWLGELGFDRKPLNEADVMILCQLSYLDMTPVMKENSEMTLRECCEKLKECGAGLNIRMFCENSRYTDFLEAAAASERFGTLKLSNYTDIFSDEGMVQFSAVTYTIDEKLGFIAYRGTDETILGWKEDFMISFTKTEAQRLSLEYAQRVIPQFERTYIAGHSKGGNLALYSSAMLTDGELARVPHIYCLDGPGLCSDVIEPEKLLRIRDKTTCMVPEYSVVGKLFEPDIPDTRVVCSDDEGIMQHDINSWQVECGHPKYAEQNSYRSVWLNGVLDKWIEDLPPAEREKFVNELFDALAKDGNRTLNDITAKGAFGLEKTLMNMAQVSEAAKKDALELPMQMIYGDTAKELKKFDPIKWVTSHRVIEFAAMTLIGIIMVLSPANILNIVTIVLMAGVTAFQVYVTLRNIRENKWNAGKELPRIYICIALAIALVSSIFKENALFYIGSLLFGTGLLVVSFLRVRTFRSIKQWNFEKVMSLSETILAAIFGLSYLVIPQSTLAYYALSIGLIMIADGFIRLIALLASTVRSKLLR